jgi:hypothetical protein
MNYMNYGKSRDLSVIWEFRKMCISNSLYDQINVRGNP